MVELHAKLGDFKGCELLLENVIKEVQQIQLLEMSLIGNSVGNAIHRFQYHLNLLQKLQCGVYSLMLTDPAEHSFVSNIAVDYPAEFIVNIIEDAKLLGFLPNRQLMNLKNEIFAFQIEPDHICNPIISEWTRHLKLDSESDFRKVRARFLKHSEKMDIDALRRAFRKTVAEETEDQKSKRLAAANFILIYSSIENSGDRLATILSALATFFANKDEKLIDLAFFTVIQEKFPPIDIFQIQMSSDYKLYMIDNSAHHSLMKRFTGSQLLSLACILVKETQYERLNALADIIMESEILSKVESLKLNAILAKAQLQICLHEGIIGDSGIILANCLRCLLVGDDLGSDYLFLSEVNTSLSDFLLMPNTEGTEWLRMAHISFHIHCTNPQLNSSRGLQLGKNIADLQSKNGQHINALETWKLVVFENC